VDNRGQYSLELYHSRRDHDALQVNGITYDSDLAH
jgi:hypothetical protein